MNLKTLISLKFILGLAGICATVFLVNGTSTAFRAVEKQNTILSDQKEIYQQIIALDADKVKEKQGLQRLTDYFDNKLEEQEESTISIDTWLYIIIGAFLVYTRLLDYLDKRIEKAKLAVNDTGEML